MIAGKTEELNKDYKTVQCLVSFKGSRCLRNHMMGSQLKWLKAHEIEESRAPVNQRLSFNYCDIFISCFFF